LRCHCARRRRLLLAPFTRVMRAVQDGWRGGRVGWKGGVGGAGGREGSAGRVGGTGLRDGRRRARAKKQSSHHPGVCVHTVETRPRHPPDPTCRPTAGERVLWDCISVPPPAGALAANNLLRMSTDLGPCVSSSHVEPVRSGAVPARQNLKGACRTSRRDPTTA